MRFNSIALSGNPSDQRSVDSIRTLAEHLAARGMTVSVSEEIELAVTGRGVHQRSGDALFEDADLAVAIGGDGAILHAARRAIPLQLPLLGINRGRLGFLADIGPDAMLDHVDAVLAGEFESEGRMLLKAELISGETRTDCGVALNDMVVKRADTGRMLEFQTFVDGEYVNTHGGDGLIVASPTGSTAYALSCGGPIVSPGLDAIVLAPICPHTLSDRPLVIPGSSVMEVRLRPDYTDRAEVSCDGEVKGTLGEGDILRVAAADHRAELIHPIGYSYFQTLRRKLRWGRGSQDE